MENDDNGINDTPPQKGYFLKQRMMINQWKQWG